MTRLLGAALAVAVFALPACLDFDAAAEACRRSGRCVDDGGGGGGGGGGVDDAGTGGGGGADDAGTGGGGGADDAGTGGGDGGTGGGTGTASALGAVVSGTGRAASSTYTFDVTIGAPSSPTKLSGPTVQLEVLTPVKP